MAWTETQTAPQEIIASRMDETGTVTRTRPVYPYPTMARYAGRRVLRALHQPRDAGLVQDLSRGIRRGRHQAR